MSNDDELPTLEDLENSLLGAQLHDRCTSGEPLSTRKDPYALTSLVAAAKKLRNLREQSCWTASEIAQRTGVPLDSLIAFEDGDFAAAGELTLLDLERLASACSGTLTVLFGPGHPWVQAARGRYFSAGCPWGVDPNG